MREQLELRLVELQQEFTVGEQKLRELEVQQARLRDTLLRIDGAIQVLREVLAREGHSPAEPLTSGSLEGATSVSGANGRSVPA